MGEPSARWNPNHADGVLARIWFTPQDSDVWVMVCDALAFNGKRFTLGRGVGHIDERGAAKVTPVAQMVLDRGLQLNEKAETLLLIELSNAGRIRRRMREAMERAPAGAFLMFIANTPALLDEMLPFLKHEAPTLLPQV